MACGSIFYSIARDILPTTQQFSPTHAFIALLQAKNKLLTQYTQNIDNLEMLAGISSDKLIQCHGSFATASCVKCHYRVPGEEIFPDIKRCVVAKCDNCLKVLAESSAAGKKRKRAKSKEKRAKNPDPWKKKRFSEDSSADEEEFNFREAGVMKVALPPSDAWGSISSTKNSPISPSLASSCPTPSTSGSCTTTAKRLTCSSASEPVSRLLPCPRL